MRAEIVGGHIQVYPDDSVEEKALRKFHEQGMNETVGVQFQTWRDGVKLPEKELVMMQFTVKGTPLTPPKKKRLSWLHR